MEETHSESRLKSDAHASFMALSTISRNETNHPSDCPCCLSIGTEDTKVVRSGVGKMGEQTLRRGQTRNLSKALGKLKVSVRRRGFTGVRSNTFERQID